jgi:hypothetical protein
MAWCLRASLNLEGEGCCPDNGTATADARRPIGCVRRIRRASLRLEQTAWRTETPRQPSPEATRARANATRINRRDRQTAHLWTLHVHPGPVHRPTPHRGLPVVGVSLTFSLDMQALRSAVRFAAPSIRAASGSASAGLHTTRMGADALLGARALSPFMPSTLMPHAASPLAPSATVPFSLKSIPPSAAFHVSPAAAAAAKPLAFDERVANINEVLKVLYCTAASRM